MPVPEELATVFVDYKDDNGKSVTANRVIFVYPSDDQRKNFAYSGDNAGVHSYYCHTLKQAVDAVLTEITDNLLDGYVESVYIKAFPENIKKATEKGNKR